MLISDLKNFWDKKKNIFYQPQEEKVLILRDKIKGLEIEKNKFITLQKITATLVADLDFERITQEIVDIMVKDLGYIGGILYLVNEKEGTIQGWTVSLTRVIVEKVLTLLSKPVREHNAVIKKKEHYISKTAATGEIFISNNLKDFIYPTVPKKVCDFAQKIIGIKVSISLPVTVKNKTIGVLMFNSNKKEFTSEEINILKTFTQQAGIAINNARQYQQIQTQVKELSEKTQDMGSLLEVAKIATSSLETRKITQGIVDSVPEKLGYLGYLGGILVLYNSKTRKVHTYCITESEIVKRAKKLLDRPYEEHSESIDEHDNFTIKTIKTKEAHIGDKLEDFIFPTVSKRVCGLIQKLVGAKSFISIPVFSGGKVMGAIIFVAAKPKEEIIQRDKDVLLGFSSHIGTAIENTQLFEQAEGHMKELLKLNNSLKRVNIKLKDLLSMKNDFLHIVSHQLRTPLTAMRGFISMWNEGDFDNLPKDKMGEIKTRIVNNVERLNNMVNDMVMAMESEGELKVEFKPVDLKKLLAGNIEMLKPSFEKKDLYLKYKETTKNIPQIEADEKLLLNVFMNLMDNSEKYTDKGGLTIAVGQYGDNVKISFIDTGIGLSKEDKKILFKKFSRGAKSNYINPNGSGLGLFIIKQIIRKHHGKIKATSKGEGKGTAFTITLPARQGR
ncbi:MAG: GAF domain-containing sensor histidine kinase [Patescibacteria group bacterium]